MRKRHAVSFLLLLLALLLLILWNTFSGSVRTDLGEMLGALLTGAADEVQMNIILDIRLPRLIAAFLLGGALAVSGYLLQIFFSNPIAGPFVLGISSGAKLMVTLFLILMLKAGRSVSGAGMAGTAFLGSMVVTGAVLLLSSHVSNMSVLVVVGIMIGYICNAVTEFCVTFAEDSQIVTLHNWTQGSFSGTDWGDVRMILLIVPLTILGCFLLSKPVGALRLGENYAGSMGVNIRRVKVLLILLSSLLSGCVTAFAGPISFVGIAVPHLMRGLFKSSDPLVMIPGCFLGGAVVTLLCDGIARTLFSPVELGISSVTAVFLAPVVISMLVRRRRV